MMRSAVALATLRRETDRELGLTAAAGVRERIGELEATLATATRKRKNNKTKPAMSGAEIARLSSEHARLAERWSRCVQAQAELRTAEELCLDALARDVDAVDLIDGAIRQRQQFRRELFWLLTALRPPGPGATLLAHSPDARAAVTAWVRFVLDAAEQHGCRGTLHIWNDHQPGWKPPWGPPRDLAWVTELFPSRPVAAALVRIAGPGADLLFGLEAGLHRFHGLAGEPAHVWVDALEPRTEFKDPEWIALPGPPTPRAARGEPMREVVVSGDGRTRVEGEDVDVPWAELPARLEEAAVVRLLAALAADRLETLWQWDRPLATLEAEAAAAEETRS
jgi:hypothetical protein